MTGPGPVIQITATAHGLENDDKVWVEGVLGNEAANGLWTVDKVNDDAFTLRGSVGNGAYTAQTGSWIQVKAIADATNASPIVVTSNNHNLADNTLVRIVGVQGNIAANGTFLVGNRQPNTFNLTVRPGNGNYTPVTDMDRVATRFQQALAKIDPTFSAPDIASAGTRTTAADGGAASGLTLLGRYKYLVVFERGDGTRSLPSAVITHIGALSGAQNMITLTAVPTGTDPQIARRLIYRTVAGGDSSTWRPRLKGTPIRR